MSHSISLYAITLSVLLVSRATLSAPPPAEPVVVAPIPSQPAEAKRPKALVGRWCGLGLCVHLSESGATLIRQAPSPESAQEGRELERGLWWVEGLKLCLSAGLESTCEPYQINPQEGRLTLKGVTLKRQAPQPAPR